MRLEIEGNISKEDYIKIAKFLKEMWKPRNDILKVIVLEGTQDMSKEEVQELMRKVFEGDDYTEIDIEFK